MEEFKVGDLCIAEYDFASHKIGSLFEIAEIDGIEIRTKETILHNPDGYLPSNKIRKALPHEIPNNELIIEIW